MSFNFLGVMRVGSYLTFRRFILHEQRSALQRLETIEAELERIGVCRISWYIPEESDDGGPPMPTERRVGFGVTAGSSLEKLMQAYTAQGGNPFDISMFLDPKNEVFDIGSDNKIQPAFTQPYGGVLYPMSRDQKTTAEGGLMTEDMGGLLNFEKNPKARMHRSFPWQVCQQTEYLIERGRRWCNQSIRDKRNELEYRIIKLMDLREQLVEEADLIRMACGGFVAGVERPSAFHQVYSAASLMQAVDNQFFAYGENGERLGVAAESLEQGVFDYLYTDYESEKWTGL
tara:strand:+ start:467 stop:1327 length:861 start_codon:yes stop_codon:yes gene_type:complete